MEEAAVEAAVHVVDAERRKGTIASEVPLDRLRTEIEAGRLVVFRGLWSAEEIIALRREVLDWAEVTEVWPQGVSASRPGINYHRIDDGTIGGRLPHVFHQFGFGDFDALPESLNSRLVPLCQAIRELQNGLAGTEFELDGGSFRAKVLRHPRGGGHVVWHSHPYLPQKVELFLNMSEPGKDYQSGGARFKMPAGELGTFGCFGIGEVLAWRYDMVHNVSPVDPEKTIEWNADDGFWLLALELVESHGKSNVEK